MKPTNLAKAGREFLEKNPNATVEDLVDSLGFKKSYATVFLHNHKRKVKQKYVPLAGDPTPDKAPTNGQNVARDELVKAFKRIEFLEIQLENLAHQITGYEAVISYLEHKLDLED
jgi:hypothetical protein